jgi:hypothetical protein
MLTSSSSLPNDAFRIRSLESEGGYQQEGSQLTAETEQGHTLEPLKFFNPLHALVTGAIEDPAATGTEIGSAAGVFGF